jgi:hypothetical protein
MTLVTAAEAAQQLNLTVAQLDVALATGSPDAQRQGWQVLVDLPELEPAPTKATRPKARTK